MPSAGSRHCGSAGTPTPPPHPSSPVASASPTRATARTPPQPAAPQPEQLPEVVSPRRRQMAAEHARAQARLEAATDVLHFGACLTEMATGRRLG